MHPGRAVAPFLGAQQQLMEKQQQQQQQKRAEGSSALKRIYLFVYTTAYLITARIVSGIPSTWNVSLTHITGTSDKFLSCAKKESTKPQTYVCISTYVHKIYRSG
uniref:Uncharacterized protein n=1 Tax=Bactrocera dorsalis TaxID=27457 RepID=A0A034WLU5_BACDO